MKYKKSFEFSISKNELLESVSRYLEENPSSQKELLKLTSEELEKRENIKEDYRITFEDNEIVVSSDVYMKVDSIELEDEMIQGVENAIVENNKKNGTSIMYFNNGYICKRKFKDDEVVSDSLKIIRRTSGLKFSRKLPFSENIKTVACWLVIGLLYILYKCGA